MSDYLWSAFMIAVFFGGSIFVHELGHFLAARRRGLKVERFSIGFGPRIFGWKGKDGVDYRLSLLPFGGYVALPQLADMSAIEGKSEQPSAPLPKISYPTKLIVFAAGAFFNVLFAFVLAAVIWGIGYPVSKEEQTTRVGYVQPTVTLADGSTVAGPAFEAGLRAGDRILKVDGDAVSTFTDIDTLVALGSGRTDDGAPRAELTVERDGKTLRVPVIPAYSGPEQTRQLGAEPAVQPMIGAVLANSAAGEAGLRAGDVILALDGHPAEYVSFVSEYLQKQGANPVRLRYERDGKIAETIVRPRLVTQQGSDRPVPMIGVSLGGRYSTVLAHIPPWTQLWHHTVTTWRTLASLVNPKSDIGPSKLSGPIGIARVFHITAQVDVRLVIWFTVLVNVNLALLNLLPIPVLDGGHILFATIARLRGRPLPTQLIATVQGAFMILLFGMILYVSSYDVRRIFDSGNVASSPPPAEAPASPASGP